MDINFDLYKYFFYVCEFKSVTKAANFLYVSQPAITKQIKKLEQALNKVLIEKTPSGISLTNDGELLYEEIKPIMEKLVTIEPKFKDKKEKFDCTLKIIAGHSTTVNLVLDSLAMFNEVNKKVKVEVSTYKFSESLDRLRENKADIIFLCVDEMKEKYSNIKTEVILKVHNILVTNKPLKDKLPEKLKLLELNNYPIVCKSDFSVARSFLETYYIENKMKFTPTYELNSNWLVEEYSKLGLGIGIVTKEFVSKYIDNKELYEVETDDEIPSKEIAVAYRTDTYNYKVVQNFVEFLKKNIKN